jgi:hypothetical protein
MSDHWDFYFFIVDGKPCSTMLDLGLVNEAPLASRPWLLSIRTPLSRPRADGLTDNPEAVELGTRRRWCAPSASAATRSSSGA